MLNRIYNNKSKGFTLIELMVVIAITSLLSAVVLASVKSAREKAQITKTVAEMKSLQNAVEMYKNQFGSYPGNEGFTGWSDDDNGTQQYVDPETGDVYSDPWFLWSWKYSGSLNNFMDNYIVNNKLMPSRINSPNYPNNCIDETQCVSGGYVLGYSRLTYNFMTPTTFGGWYFACGDQKINNYFIFFLANNKKINLPILKYRNINFPSYNYDPISGVNTYCLSM